MNKWKGNESPRSGQRRIDRLSHIVISEPRARKVPIRECEVKFDPRAAVDLSKPEYLADVGRRPRDIEFRVKRRLARHIENARGRMMLVAVTDDGRYEIPFRREYWYSAQDLGVRDGQHQGIVFRFYLGMPEASECRMFAVE